MLRAKFFPSLGPDFVSCKYPSARFDILALLPYNLERLEQGLQYLIACVGNHQDVPPRGHFTSHGRITVEFLTLGGDDDPMMAGAPPVTVEETDTVQTLMDIVALHNKDHDDIDLVHNGEVLNADRKVGEIADEGPLTITIIRAERVCVAEIYLPPKMRPRFPYINKILLENCKWESRLFSLILRLF